MKSSTTNLLLIIGAVAIGVYGFLNGWFTSTAQARTNVRTVDAGGNDFTETTTPVSEPIVDHTDQGYVLIPVDRYGNVVPQHMATQFIRYAHQGQDCNVQYGNRVYVIRVKPTPPPPPPVV